MEPSLRKLFPWFTFLSLLTGALVVAAFYKDQFREWKAWQRKFKTQELSAPRRDARSRGLLRMTSLV